MAGTSVRPWQALLQLFMAGIFGLVLPFVCWGAQAMPGHPHAHAHFVFWPPELAHARQLASMPVSLAQFMQSAAICGDPTPGDAAAPAGVATPSVLAIFLLLAVYCAGLFTPYNDAPGFMRRQAAPLRRWFATSCEPPPPRVARPFVFCASA